MTAHRPTLLEALARVSPFRGRTEDIAVEALGHILSTSEAARAALADVVDAGGAPVGPIARVRTQVTGEKGARPDLAGFDESGFERVLIEAKFAAGLTDNQPVAYLERLQRAPGGRPTALLFVSPTARVESLWAELCRRAGIAPESVRKEGGVRSAALAGAGPRLLLASWTALLDRMLDRVANIGDSQAEADIQQLQGLAQREGKDVFRPLRPEELQDRDSPLLVLLVEYLVDVAIVRAARRPNRGDTDSACALQAWTCGSVSTSIAGSGRLPRSSGSGSGGGLWTRAGTKHASRSNRCEAGSGRSSSTTTNVDFSSLFRCPRSEPRRSGRPLRLGARALR